MNKALLMKILVYGAVGLGAILLYKKVSQVQNLVDRLPGFAG
jgi:hypothetical protein